MTTQSALERDEVAATRLEPAVYPDEPPFHPDEAYPEYELGATAGETNRVYRGVRRCFELAGLDADRAGTEAWNPLRDLIDPDETVMLKPNFIKEEHPRDPDGWKYVLTHGSVIRAVADYVFRALGDEGRVIVADGPQTNSSFAEIVEVLGLDDVRSFYREQGRRFELVDLRQQEWESRDSVVVNRLDLDGDPLGYAAFDLADRSEFEDHDGEGRYYGADYDSEEVNYHHSEGRHEYLIAASAVDVDVLFSLPKMKTHKKAGVTLSLKNLVGINGDKNWLPHHTEAGGGKSGDEHPDPDPAHQAERAIVPLFRKLSLEVPVVGPQVFRLARTVGEHIFGATEETIRSGNWWGNDTCWRMCLDLNKLLFYGRPDGTFRPDSPGERKRHYVLCDGVVAGEGRGPMNPDPKRAGTLVFGRHPASADAACTWLMGFDPEKIPIVRQAFKCDDFSLAEWGWRDITVGSDVDRWDGPLAEIPDSATFRFEPHFGWVGHIERNPPKEERGEASAVPDGDETQRVHPNGPAGH
ncbi:MAG: DUF362 domain-containing protein [Bradymonadaceae bacterium]